MKEDKPKRGRGRIVNNCMGGGIYFFAFLGVLVYYLQHAHSFMEGILGILKAIVWPGMITFKVLEMLKM